MNMMLNKILTLVVFTVSVAGAPRLWAQDSDPAAALAAESAAYCTSTINKDRPTPPSIIVDKVNEACALLEKEGPAAFPKFSGKGSRFIFEGTYICVQGINDGQMLMHPIQYKLAGTKMTGMKDAHGKRIFVTFQTVAKEKGEGWAEYYWPKPGTGEIAHKISFIKKCTMSNGVDVLLVSGLYNFSDADVAKLELH
jgi:hypothetical protein